MVTRGTTTVNAAIDAAFDALLAACKDMDANIKHSDKHACTIDGESGTIWLQNRFSFKFHARLLDQHGTIVLEVFDFSPFDTDKRFIGQLFEKLKKRLPVSELSYSNVSRVWDTRPVSLPGSTDAAQSAIVESTTHAKAPFVLDEADTDPAAKDAAKAGFETENPAVPPRPGDLSCPQCNSSIPQGSKFCRHCGAKL